MKSLADILRLYEDWETDILLNGDWSQSTVRLTQSQHDRMIELQEMRNAALAEPDREIEEAKRQARDKAFADMRKHADAVMLGATNKPKSVHELFIKALEEAYEGRLPPRPSLSFAERRFIAQEFIMEFFKESGDSDG